MGTPKETIEALKARQKQRKELGLIPESYPVEVKTTTPVEGPGVLKQMLNFGKAAVNHLISGLKLAPVEVQQERLKICSNCEYKPKDKDTCLHAGCGCVLSTKVTWAEQECPLDPPKWGKYT